MDDRGQADKPRETIIARAEVTGADLECISAAAHRAEEDKRREHGQLCRRMMGICKERQHDVYAMPTIRLVAEAQRCQIKFASGDSDAESIFDPQEEPTNSDEESAEVVKARCKQPTKGVIRHGYFYRWEYFHRWENKNLYLRER